MSTQPSADQTIIAPPTRFFVGNPATLVLLSLALIAALLLIALAYLVFTGGLPNPATDHRQGLQLMALIGATFISEDLTCITAGLLIHRGELSLPIGLLGCTIGIIVGDVGLWLIGRLGWRGIRQHRWISNRLPARNPQQWGRWLDQHLLWVVLGARFVPGSRLPTYLALGAWGSRPYAFLFWLAIASLLWTPLLILSVAWLGSQLAKPLEHLLAHGWLMILLPALLLTVLLHLGLRLAGAKGRSQLGVQWQRMRHYEYWPSWLFYLPMIPVWLYLAFRYRGPLTFTAANPAIPHSGLVGESKSSILRQLGPHHVARFTLIPPGPVDRRMQHYDHAVDDLKLDYPLILKPDAGQRGASVRLIHQRDQAVTYLREHTPAALLQAYHPGPGEAGIFYFRLPGDAHGQLFAITHKIFPVIIGDGQNTLAQLIQHHPRYRLQSVRFFQRFRTRLDEVLPQGQTLRLAQSGNHCQGVMFVDGEHLRTPALEQAVDAVLRRFEGFYFGRMDVRYTDVQGFRAGHDFTILELNGVTSEATNLYDPSWSIMRAYYTLIRQWSLAYRIGRLNRQKGHRASRMDELIKTMHRFYRFDHPDDLAD